MTDGFEASFTVAVPRAEAWARLEKGRDDRGWFLPAFESRIEALDVVDGERLRARKLDQPCADTEIVVTLEDEGSGTRVRVVQSGFGAWADAMRDVLAVGWGRIVADLAMYLEHGASAHRHRMAWSDPGAQLRSTAAGVVVEAVSDRGWAARRGVQPGDVIVAVGAAPITSRGDLETALLSSRDGAVTVVRAGEVVRG